jgi:MoxR-like ATPase
MSQKDMSELLRAMNQGERAVVTSEGVTSEPKREELEPRSIDEIGKGADVGVTITSKSDPSTQRKADTVIVGNVPLPVKTDLSPEELKYVPSATVYIDNKGVLGDIAQFINANIPVLVEGETGVGKTSAFRYLAGLTQNAYRRLNLNGSTTVDEFVGKIMLDEKGTKWVDGVLTDAMRKGHWLVLDEINAALPEILFVLHSVLDDDGYVVLAEHTGEVVRPHANFRVFATMNPSDGQYSGTKELNQAFLDRFVKTTFGFPTLAQERKMVEKRYPTLSYVTKAKLTEMLKYVGEMRTAYSNGAQEFLISPRGVLQWVRLAEMFNDISKAAEYALIEKAPSEERNAIRDVLKLRFGLGIMDYVPQCQKNNVYSVGDEVVVSVPQGELSDVHVDFTGLYEVTSVDAPPVRDGETEVDRERIAYDVKCKAKNITQDPLQANGSRVRLGQLLTTQYHGDTGLNA